MSNCDKPLVHIVIQYDIDETRVVGVYDDRGYAERHRGRLQKKLNVKYANKFTDPPYIGVIKKRINDLTNVEIGDIDMTSFGATKWTKGFSLKLVRQDNCIHLDDNSFHITGNGGYWLK